jgi:hypothetical protein
MAKPISRLSEFVPTSDQPEIWPYEKFEVSGTIDGQPVRIEFAPPGSTYWRDTFGVWIDGRKATYQEAHDLAAALRKPGWSYVADSIVRRPTAANLFSDLSEVSVEADHDAFGGELYDIVGRIAPDSTMRIQYRPTTDGRGLMYLMISGGEFDGASRTMDSRDRYLLAERLIHSGDSTRFQLADQISPQAVRRWRQNIPDTLEPTAGPSPLAPFRIVSEWLQRQVNWFNRD